MDNRLGTYNDDGSVSEWPAKTITGQDYNRYVQPHATTRLSKRHFAVMDLNPLSAEARDKLLDEMRALLSKPDVRGRVNEPARTGE